eukprot:8051356-Prorocentrum_lima.AAC.1
MANPGMQITLVKEGAAIPPEILMEADMVDGKYLMRTVRRSEIFPALDTNELVDKFLAEMKKVQRFPFMVRGG